MPLPTGNVTFLFTDIEGSTRLWEEQPDRMRHALAAHDALARKAIEGHHGAVVKTTAKVALVPVSLVCKLAGLARMIAVAALGAKRWP